MNWFFKTLIFILLICSHNLAAQDHLYRKRDKDLGQSEGGKIKIHQDSRVDSILQRHINYNRQSDGIDGYRIHIFFEAGNLSLSKANQAASRYQMLYPGDTAYVSFSEPYYRVRVGDFRTRLDAEGYLQKIIRDYPNAFVIKDKINFPRID